MGELLQSDRRALIVAIDHTLACGVVPGWERPAERLEAVLSGGPDAILTTFGILKQFGPLIRQRARTVLRLDGGQTEYLESWGEYTQWESLYSVEDALRLGADAVIVNLFLGGPVELRTTATAARAASACLRWGMPLTVEAMPARTPTSPSMSDPARVASAARIGAELGADLIKTYYTASIESFRKVTSACPVPVLIAGGEKMDSDRAVLEMVNDALEAGGAGVFFGRNVWQHDRPAQMVRALRALIHERATVDQALGVLHGG
jgi:class I fructose-bisphosphate aldolase